MFTDVNTNTRKIFRRQFSNIAFATHLPIDIAHKRKIVKEQVKETGGRINVKDP